MASLGDTVSDGTVRQQTSDEDFFALQERHRDSDCDCAAWLALGRAGWLRQWGCFLVCEAIA
jgi:hypothetical protein